ncbi:uncharacterized protein FTOL_07437 [Fusarium torulosum]|uniref:Nephrocystin 3-like N-terminal domain-containing protein n=1 Tax=Fusarium torulosum TaxID=33205 RepID=A0AAE8MAU2_9HYPO|nr:uncharacterized protein FTOL_07437 [Fusarium torulosum]
MVCIAPFMVHISLLVLHSSDFDAQTLQHQERFHDIIYSIQSANARNDHSHDRIESYIQAQNDAIMAENKHSQLLESLRAPEMCKRYNDLMNSSEADLDGVVASYNKIANNEKALLEGDRGHITNNYDNNQGPTNPTQASKKDDEGIDWVWLSFLAWLKSDYPLFCIQGKPGSGKSTLMKFLIDNEKTKELLRHLADTEAGSKIMAHATLSHDEIDEELIRRFLCVCNVLHSKCGMSAYTASVLHQISHIVERTGSEKSQLTANLLQIVQRLHANDAIGNSPSWKPKSKLLSFLTEFRCFHDYIVSTLQRSPSVTTATAVLRNSWGHDRFLDCRREKLTSLELVKALLSLGANPHIQSIDNKWWTYSDEPLVSNDTTFRHLLKYGVMGVFRSAYAGGNLATFILKMVLNRVTTCRDLEAPPLAILEVLLSAQSFHVFLEVKLGFLLSYLISNLKHLVDDNDVISQAE